MNISTEAVRRVATRTLCTLIVPALSGLWPAAPAARAQQAGDEMTAAEIEEFEGQKAELLRWLARQPQLRMQRPVIAHSVCGNGDFEGRLDPAEWTGGHGFIFRSGQPNTGDPDFDNFISGLVAGPLPSRDSHQTLVSAGSDPTVGITQVAPIGLTGPGSTSGSAVRIGNAGNRWGSELLSKTFTVSSQRQLIPFWYALVLENPPGHSPVEQPSFWVRVLDSAGNEITGAVDLGNGSAQAVADRDNPFFQALGTAGIVYRDWSCAQIDLSDHVGETVTVQFVTEDCAQGAHYGYAYVDNYCGTCAGDPSGSVTFDPAVSGACGGGEVCVDYTLPAAAGASGSAVIELAVEVNGAAVYILTSPTLTSGTRHCFDLDPASFAPGGAQVDLVATAQLSLGGVSLAPKSDRIDGYELSCDPCRQAGASRCCRFGACCVGSACVQVAPGECEKLGGLYFGDLSSCQVGACCTANGCVRIPRSECDKLDGAYRGDQTTCKANTCLDVVIGPGPRGDGGATSTQ